ncbi:MAG: ubiquitin-like domain-containing protein [Caldicoprobacterales bacterium]
MNSHNRGFWIVCIAFLTALGIAGTATAKLIEFVQNPIKHVVLDDDGYCVEISTYDSSVGELLNRYGIVLEPGDEISPALDAPLEKNTEVKITRAMTVTVEADGRKKELRVTSGTVEDILKEAEVKLREYDLVNLPLNRQVMPFDNIQVTRRMPVTVEADGDTKELYITGGTVEDVLGKAEIQLREKDLVNYPLDRQAQPYDKIVVTRIDEEIVIENENIPYKVVTKKNKKMDEGVTRVVQEGEEGRREKKILITYKDGVEVGRELVYDKVIKKPVNRVVEKGTAKHVTTARGDKLRYKKARKMTATAYSAEYRSTGKNPGEKYYGVTASGKKVKSYHTIAAPPDIPFGTKVYIPELVQFWKKRGVTIDGIFTVEDRGGAIKGNAIDIYMENGNITRSWGRRTVTVYFLD